MGSVEKAKNVYKAVYSAIEPLCNTIRRTVVARGLVKNQNFK